MPQITIEVPHSCLILVADRDAGEHPVTERYDIQQCIDDLARQLHVATGAQLIIKRMYNVNFGIVCDFKDVTNPPAPLKRPA